jgi:hypothetical protein
MHLPLKMPTLQDVLSFTKPRFSDQPDGQRLQVHAYNQVGLSTMFQLSRQRLPVRLPVQTYNLDQVGLSTMFQLSRQRLQVQAYNQVGLSTMLQFHLL